jgi:hypothetical protein
VRAHAMQPKRGQRDTTSIHRSEWREETTADVCEERVADSRQHIPHIPQGPDRVQAGAPSIIADKLEDLG